MAIGSTTRGSAATSSRRNPLLIWKVARAWSGSVGGTRGKSFSVTSGSAAAQSSATNAVNTSTARHLGPGFIVENHELESLNHQTHCRQVQFRIPRSPIQGFSERGAN